MNDTKFSSDGIQGREAGRSGSLQTEFPGVSGYSSRNLWYTRSFYLCYGSNEKLQLLVAEIGWTHNLIIMEKCKDDLEREFYISMTRKFGWTKNVLAIYLVTSAGHMTRANTF